MAKNTRIELKLPSGRQSDISLNRARALIEQGRMVWIEEPLTVQYVSRQEYVDFSRQMTDRVFWKGKESGKAGPTVLQLCDSPRGSRYRPEGIPA